MNNIEKEEWLSLTEALQRMLAGSLNSLGGRQSDGLHDQFIFYSSIHINRTVVGYVALLRSGLEQSAVLLVRPTLEAMFRILAVRKDPAVVCRIAASEREDERRWLRSFGTDDAKKGLIALDGHWAEFERLYRKKHPAHAFSQEGISLFDLAKVAGLEHAYNSHYRLYCKFTHAALRAAIGGLDEIVEEDRSSMAGCTAVAIDALIAIGAKAEGYAELQKKLSEMDARDRAKK